MRLHPLDRKLLRDLVHMRWQVLAIALLIACGVSVSVMAFSAHEALKAEQTRYYRETRFADVFATAKRAPLFVVRDLARLDGVVAVDARAGKAGLMEVPGLVRPAVARLISLPDDERAALNRLVLMRGRMPDPERTDEVVALKTFLDAAHVSLGQRLSVVIDGRRMTFKIVGSALSPEYVYVPGAASALPDDAHEAVLWGPRRMVEKAAGLGGAFSVVSLKVARGVPVKQVIEAVDRALAPYGGAPTVGRADQVSNKFQDDHIARLATLAWVIPPIFLAVAAALVGLVLGRLVEIEREQIGLLKAFGYDDLTVASTYLKMAVAIALVGAVAGGLAGAWIGGQITQMMGAYMRYPRLTSAFSWGAFAVAATVSAAAAAGGSAGAVRRALALSPAVAMRPPAPMLFRKGLVERLAVWRQLDQSTRIIVRNLERRPGRAALTALGLGVSLSLLVGSQFMFGSIDEIVDQAYFRARHWTEIVGFAELRDVAAVRSAERLPGVLAAEPVRTSAAIVRGHGEEQKAVVSGFDSDARLVRALDTSDRPIPFRGRSLVLTESLSKRLGAGPGDSVEIEITEGRRPRVVLPVTAVARDYAGYWAYLDRGLFNRLMGDGNLANGAYLEVAQDQRPDFYRAVARTPQIVSASSRLDTIASWRASVAQTMNIEMWFYVGFAAAIAFGVAYNVSRIALSDRARDLATLRVLGFGEGECAYILLGELAMLALAASPVGALGGMGLAWLLVKAFAHQEMSFPLIFAPHEFGFAFAAYVAAILAAAVFVGLRIRGLDLVAVLKTRD